MYLMKGIIKIFLALQNEGLYTFIHRCIYVRNIINIIIETNDAMVFEMRIVAGGNRD